MEYYEQVTDELFSTLKRFEITRMIPSCWKDHSISHEPKWMYGLLAQVEGFYYHQRIRNNPPINAELSHGGKSSCNVDVRRSAASSSVRGATNEHHHHRVSIYFHYRHTFLNRVFYGGGF